jgi:hypothetical protein
VPSVKADRANADSADYLIRSGTLVTNLCSMAEGTPSKRSSVDYSVDRRLLPLFLSQQSRRTGQVLIELPLGGERRMYATDGSFRIATGRS